MRIWSRVVQKEQCEKVLTGGSSPLLGAALSSGPCLGYACALLAWTLTSRHNFLFYLRPTLTLWTCLCHHGLAWQSLQCCLIQVIDTSSAMFLKGTPLLMRLVLSPLAHLPLRRSPFFLKDGSPGVLETVSENNTTEYWNPNLPREINADFLPCITKSLLRCYSP